MYLIINYDWNTRYPETFYTYKKSFKKFKELNDNTNVLEFWDIKNQTRKVLIDRRRRDRRYNK